MSLRPIIQLCLSSITDKGKKCLYWINTPPEKYSITQRNPVILRIPSSKYSCSFHCIHEYSCIWQQQDSYTHVFLLLMHFYLKNPTSNAIWIEIQSKCNFKIHPPSRYVCILKPLKHSAEIQKHFVLLRYFVKSMLVISKTLLCLKIHGSGFRMKYEWQKKS